jgi:hypothetical protein
MPHSATYKSIAQRLGPICSESFSMPPDIARILKNAQDMHLKSKRIAEAKAKQPDRATQGGAAGMSSAMFDHFDFVLRNDLYKLTQSRNPEVKRAAKDAYQQIETMQDWWKAQYTRWTA